MFHTSSLFSHFESPSSQSWPPPVGATAIALRAPSEDVVAAAGAGPILGKGGSWGKLMITMVYFDVNNTMVTIKN